MSSIFKPASKQLELGVCILPFWSRHFYLLCILKFHSTITSFATWFLCDGVVITVKRSSATEKQCQSHWQILPWISFSFRFAGFSFYWDAACVAHIINEPILGYSQGKCEQVQPWRTRCTFSSSSQTSAWPYKRSRPCLTGKGQCCQEAAGVRGYGPSDGS